MLDNAKPLASKHFHETLVGIKELSKILACSIISCRRWEQNGTIPRALRVGPQEHRRWKRSEITAWISKNRGAK